MRRLLLIAAVGFSIQAIGCGGPSDSTPIACLEGTRAYLRALERAPGQVRLSDQTPISECLAENQQGGDLATVGLALVTAATRLNSEARAQPGGTAGVELGYLLGAAERGAADTEGIHADLIRRLVVAARYSPGGRPLPPAFRRAYRTGYAAGERGG